MAIHLPSHYPTFFQRMMRFALIMIFIALLSGILFQESAKKATYADLAPGLHLETVIHLALLHGHVFLIGTLIPMIICWMCYLGLCLGKSPASEKLLRWGSRLYLSGAALSVFLMLYKGYHFLLSVRFGETDFAIIEQNYFFGIAILRHIVYGTAHIGMGIGLTLMAIALWKSLSKPSPQTPTVSSGSEPSIPLH